MDNFDLDFKKFAILNYNGKSSNSGGPRGYLFNLFEGFIKKGYKAPSFLYSKNANSKSVNGSNVSVKKLLGLRKILSFFKKGIGFRKEFKSITKSFDIIHVHSVEDCYFLRRFARYKGKIILTPHMPEPLKCEQLRPLEISNHKKYRVTAAFYSFVERKAYSYADAFIFPSCGAMSIYNTFPGFIIGCKKKPIEFVFTGCEKKDVSIDAETYRKKIGLLKSDFVITFVGRHNEIKGYDRLIRSFEILKKNKLKVVVAGAQSETFIPPDDPDWIELGYISDSNNLMNASDLVVIPNRSTYFDLIIVEALSLGKIILSSNTGGNIDIASMNKGLIVFDNENESSFEELVLKIKSMDLNEKQELENESANFYSNYCTLEKFASNYMNSIYLISRKIFNHK